MFIKSLKINNFRILENKEFLFSNKVNIFFGNNGVGKTSILEAIHYISTGKSFRKSSYKNLIKFNTSYLNIQVNIITDNLSHLLSVNKSKNGTWKAKLNNSSLAKQSKLSNLLPVVSIDPEIYRLVDLGPIYRRNFLDWLVFHVKHDYLVLWKKVQKCTKQLNSLYKKKATIEEIELWENMFIEFSEQLNFIRQQFFTEISPIIHTLTSHMQNDIKELNVSYHKGWSDNISLKDQLLNDREKNLIYGQLQHGPHKMDIKIHISQAPASQVLSRGQKKVLSLTFYISYIQILLNHKIKPIVCLDDLDAELDNNKLLNLSEFFLKSDLQLFITSVLPDKIKKTFPKAQMFHVKH